MKLSQRTTSLTPSTILSINALATQRKKEGLPVYNLSAGEPDLPTPENIGKAAIKAIEKGVTKYTAVGGTDELKQAIGKKLLQDLGITYSSSQITCSNGAKQILFNLFQVLLDEGDEVLCFSPYWVSYRTQIELSGGKLVEVNLNREKNFSFDPDLLESCITERTVAILLNSPNNPTGQVFDETSLRRIADIAGKHDLLVISDDVYEYFYFTEKKPSHILKIAPDLAGQTILVNSVSKTYSMTGWRLGFAAGPVEIISKMEELQSHTASNPSSVSQMAALEALSGPQESVEKMREIFLTRRNDLMALLTGMNFIRPDGAFYLLLDISTKKKPGESDLEFCLDLLRETGVAVVPGDAFGSVGEGFVRISFASAWETIETGIHSLRSFGNK